MFHKKSVGSLLDTFQKNPHHLKRTLSRLDLLLLGIGTIIGAGIFVLTGQAAARYAGPAIALSFAASGVVCGLTGLCYAELASTVPSTGSVYSYAYVTMGELIAWIVGWDIILEYALGATTVAVGWSGYFKSFLEGFGIHPPAQWMYPTGTQLLQVPAELAARLGTKAQWMNAGALQPLLDKQGIHAGSLASMTAVFNLPAAFIVLLVTVVIVIGIQESARVNNLLVMVKIAVVAIFLIVGMPHFSTAHWQGHFLPANTGEFGHFGWSGILRGAAVVFFAFIGFDTVATTSLESKEPAKDVSFGILGSLAICSLLYVVVAMVLTGIVDFQHSMSADPLAVGLDSVHAVALSPVLKLGSLIGLASVVLGLLLSQSRVCFTMAEDGLLPPLFAHLHKKFRTPYIASIGAGVVIAFGAGTLPIEVVGELVSIGTLFVFAIASVGVLILRRTQPDLPRPFRVPAIGLVAPLGALTALGFMAGLPLVTWIRFIVWMAVGLVLYFVYGRGRAAHVRKALTA